MHIVVLGHCLVQKCYWGRWQRLAEMPAHEVTLIVPARWESVWFGNLTTYEPQVADENTFDVRPVPVTNCRNWGRYALKSMDAHLRKLKPDIILVYGEEFSVLLHQFIVYRRLWAPRAKLGFFTWNNLTILGGRKQWLKKRLWCRVCRGADFAIAGNQEGKHLIQDAGYPKKNIVQTEIGVDESFYYPDQRKRKKMRECLGLNGYATRNCS